MSGEASPVVMRFYRESAETDYCADAVRLLLNFKESKQKGARSGAPDAAKESENGCDAPRIIPR
jgi:hypothetical protein